jgi:murein DD-endopeptidase MepM/ murein hydrolase activator NlpD
VRGRGRGARLAVLSLLLALVAAPLPAGAEPFVSPTPGFSSSAAPGPVRYQAPVAGEVLRSFDAPETSFGTGHRGVDLAATPGTGIRAAGDGIVTFAGRVADTRWVAIDHGDGIVTSYGPLDPRTVDAGRAVRRGELLGTLAAGGHGLAGHDRGLHWGARRAGHYIDPLGLLQVGIPRPSLVGPGGWRGSAMVVQPYDPWQGGGPGGWRTSASPVAIRPGFAVPPNPNHLVLVPGLATSSAARMLDPAHLGYDPRSVTRFSYAGRSDGLGDPAAADRDQLPYGPEHTWPGVDAAASLLRDQLRAQAAREPGRAVDLVGHSMGGVVILRYLTEHHDAYDRSLPPIGHVVTYASPLTGSDLAALAGDIGSHAVLGTLAAALGRSAGATGTAVGRRIGALPLDVPAIADLRPGSPLLRELAADVEHALHDGPAGPLAMGTRVLTIGGGGDQVVGAYRTRLPRDPTVALDRALSGERSGPAGSGSELSWQPWDDGPPLEHRVLPGGHTDVLRTEAAREVAWRFLAGEEVVAAPGRLAHLTSEEGGTTIRLTGWLVRLHDVAWGPLRRAMRPTPTVPGR